MAQVCGVNKNFFSVYDFKDQNFFDPTHPTHNELYQWLSTIAIQQASGEYLVKDKLTNNWVRVDKLNVAATALNNQYSGIITLPSGVVKSVGSEDIKGYLKHACPVISGTIHIPLGPDFVIFNGPDGIEKRMNIFRNHIVKGDCADLEYTYDLLRIIRESLCAKSNIKSRDEMMEDLINKHDDEKDFRFVMNWLAAIYQNPGINLQTNLWFIGSTKGIGKGTLCDVLRGIFGSSAVGKVKETELERGWNNFIVGKLIMEADEFRGSDKVDSNRIIKRDSTNTILSITKRGTSPYDIPNITNWIFTTNDEAPMVFEDGDRRNVLINTTYDTSWKQYCIDFNRRFETDLTYRKQVISGFAGLLDQLPVEWDLIALAYDTDIKLENVDNSKNAAERWIMDDTTYERDVFIQMSDLFKYFERWKVSNDPDSRIKSDKSLGMKLGTYVRQGKIVRERISGKGTFYKVLGEHFPKQEALTEDERAQLGLIPESKLKVVDFQAALRKFKD